MAESDPQFPAITSRRGASGCLSPVLRATGIRVQTLVVAARHWGLSEEEIAEQYDLPERSVAEALRFYEAHPLEIDSAIGAEERLADQAARS